MWGLASDGALGRNLGSHGACTLTAEGLLFPFPLGTAVKLPHFPSTLVTDPIP